MLPHLSSAATQQDNIVGIVLSLHVREVYLGWGGFLKHVLCTQFGWSISSRSCEKIEKGKLSRDSGLIEGEIQDSLKATRKLPD